MTRNPIAAFDHRNRFKLGRRWASRLHVGSAERPGSRHQHDPDGREPYQEVRHHARRGGRFACRSFQGPPTGHFAAGEVRAGVVNETFRRGIAAPAIRVEKKRHRHPRRGSPVEVTAGCVRCSKAAQRPGQQLGPGRMPLPPWWQRRCLCPPRASERGPLEINEAWWPQTLAVVGTG